MEVMKRILIIVNPDAIAKRRGYTRRFIQYVDKDLRQLVSALYGYLYQCHAFIYNGGACSWPAQGPECIHLTEKQFSVPYDTLRNF